MSTKKKLTEISLLWVHSIQIHILHLTYYYLYIFLWYKSKDRHKILDMARHIIAFCQQDQ